MSRLRSGLLAFLVVSGLYLYAWPAATLFYASIVLLHLAAGVVFAILLFPWLRQGLSYGSRLLRLGGSLLGAGAALGILLAFTGTLRPMQPWLFAHIASCVAGVVFIGVEWLAARGWLGGRRAISALRAAGLCSHLQLAKRQSRG